MTSKPQVRAAGGVVARESAEGAPQILLIHRPKYADWSFPKGKLMDGETDEECAVREVQEETGFKCEIGHELKSVSYVDRHGRNKIVRYWVMSPMGGSFTPNNEVDQILWATPAEAALTLSYPHDRELLGEVAKRANG